jgi:pre-mRNA-splicing factor SYF1
MASSLSSGRQPDLALVVRFELHSWWRIGLADTPSQSEDDFPYEQDIQRNPGSTKPWLAYIEYKLQHGTVREQAFVMERACVQLPRSYKLWKMVSSSSPLGSHSVMIS